LLKEQKSEDILLFGGGIIPDDEIPGLLEAGVAALFTPGAPLKDITDFLRERFAS
jgi:methylmalonyl-CoA mutase C-terminal domain/subunit